MSNQYPVSYLEMSVGWGDTDAAGISYYARYFDWFCNGRFKLLKDHGVQYTTWFHKYNASLVVLETGCKYQILLYPEEPVILETTLVTLTQTRAKFNYRILKKDQRLAASGFTSHAYVNDLGKPCNLEKHKPELWKRLSEAFF